METRIATADDAGILFEMNELFGNETTPEAIRRSLLQNDREVACIAFIGGVAAGYCTGLIVRSLCYCAERAEIEALYVREEYRRMCVGKALLGCLENAMAARGIRHFHINTGADNRIAQELYRKTGYADSGEVLLEKTV